MDYILPNHNIWQKSTKKQESEEHTSDLTKSLPKRPDCSNLPKISKTLLYESRCMTPFYTNFTKGKYEQQQT